MNKPNLVYLLADDVGWCVCSPTRALLLTGRHPLRVGIGPNTGGELAKEETTITEAFKANGYRTSVFGKWHSRDNRPQDVDYTEDLITGYVLEFLREDGDRRFFCYSPFHIVARPLRAKDPNLAGVDAKVTDEPKRVYAAMVQAMDKNVVAILAERDKLGLRDRGWTTSFQVTVAGPSRFRRQGDSASAALLDPHRRFGPVS